MYKARGKYMNAENGVINRISKQMIQKNINRSELANRCGWSMSRTSKVLGGMQKITIDDIVTIAQALQINPAILIAPNIDNVNFDQKNIMPLSEIFQRIYKYSNSKERLTDLIETELPHTINSYLSLSDTGKSVDIVLRPIRINNDERLFNMYPRVIITDKREGQLFGDELTVGYWFDEDWSGVYISIHYLKKPLPRCSKKQSEYDTITNKNMRELFVALSNGKLDCTEKMRLTERSSRTGMKYEAGCIYCKRYDFSILISEEQYKRDLQTTYELYLKLLETTTKRVQETFEEIYQNQRIMERENNIVQASGSFGICDFNRVMKTTTAKNIKKVEVQRDAIQKAQYLCEIDSKHESFIDRRTDKPYMIPTHIIPHNAQADFDKMLEITANYCCLCPVCNAKLAYGTDIERQEMLMKLYTKHKLDLKKAGIEITPMQLFKLHGMN